MTMAVLFSQEQLLRQLETTVERTLYTGLAADSIFSNLSEEERSANAQKWLSWTLGQKNLKAVTFKVPAGILPEHLEGELTDVRVFSRGPDDKVYDQNALFRKRVARGNCVLEVRNRKDHSSRADAVIFALKKFTGGLGKPLYSNLQVTAASCHWTKPALHNSVDRHLTFARFISIYINLHKLSGNFYFCR